MSFQVFFCNECKQVLDAGATYEPVSHTVGKDVHFATALTLEDADWMVNDEDRKDFLQRLTDKLNAPPEDGGGG